MAHKKKNERRGETFVGFAPKVEPTKRERMEKMYRKHKQKGADYER